jgi:hypothetical protein
MVIFGIFHEEEWIRQQTKSYRENMNINIQFALSKIVADKMLKIKTLHKFQIPRVC